MMPRRLPLFLFVAALCIAPLVLRGYPLLMLNYVGLSVIVVLGLVLLTGVGGLTSFGQAAFVGMGAYAAAWLTTAMSWNPWLSLIAGLAAVVIGMAAARSLARLRRGIQQEAT